MQEQIDAVQKMQDYIASNIQKDIMLSDLANISGYSPWHCYRLFKIHTSFTVADYIRRLKLTKSALKLRDEKVKVIDVAFELGFKSVDGYQRAFKAEFGCNPKEFAFSPIPLGLFTPFGVKYKAKLKESKTMNEVKSVFLQVVEKEARKAIIKRGIKADNYMDYCGEVGCDIWGVLVSMKSLCGEPVSMWLPQKYIKPNTSEYVQGVEVAPDYNGVIPEGFDVIELPKAKYLKFQGEPFEEEDYCEAIENVWSAIEKYNPKSINCEWDKDNPRIQLEPIGERGYIELVAIK